MKQLNVSGSGRIVGGDSGYALVENENLMERSLSPGLPKGMFCLKKKKEALNLFSRVYRGALFAHGCDCSFGCECWWRSFYLLSQIQWTLVGVQ